MIFAERVDRVPFRCSFYPQLGPEHPEGFVLSRTLIDDHYGVAVSVVALKEIAATLPQAGICPREELEQAQAELADTQRELEDLRAQMEHYDKELDAVSYLKGRGYQAVKKSGRPPKTAAKAA